MTSWLELMVRITQWLCADPLNIPSLTNCILRHLREAPVGDTDDFAQITQPSDAVPELSSPSLSPVAAKPPPQSRLEFLPLELLSAILFYLPFPSALILSHTSKTLHKRLLTQTFWRDVLIAGDAIGYLWDLDGTACRAKQNSIHSWDWKSLVRELARRDCFEDGREFKDVPKGLRNRQRIWKVLIDA